MTAGLAIAVVVLAIVALWQIRRLGQYRRIIKAVNEVRPDLMRLAPDTGAHRPDRPTELEQRVGHIERNVISDDRLETIVRRIVERVVRGDGPGDPDWTPSGGWERGEPLERYVNRALTGRMETFRLGIEQQLPMLAALRYATDEKLADVVVGLRAAIPPAAPAAALPGTGAAQLPAPTDGDEAKA